MASYCTVDDIKREFKGLMFQDIDDVNSVKTSTTKQDVEEWIQQESDYIDGFVSKIYVIPLEITAVQSLRILRRICIFRVSARVKNKNEMKNEVNQLNSDEKFLQNKVMTPNDDLMNIIKKNLVLPDATEVDKEGGLSYLEIGVDTCERVFNPCKQQW